VLAGCPGCGTLGISIVPRLRPGAFVLGNAFGALRLGTRVISALSLNLESVSDSLGGYSWTVSKSSDILMTFLSSTY
jgi:hypothetical protein